MVGMERASMPILTEADILTANTFKHKAEGGAIKEAMITSLNKIHIILKVPLLLTPTLTLHLNHNNGTSHLRELISKCVRKQAARHDCVFKCLLCWRAIFCTCTKLSFCATFFLYFFPFTIIAKPATKHPSKIRQISCTSCTKHVVHATTHWQPSN